MKYRQEIDGLRAVAVLPVILYHAGFSWFSGGYTGVDVFFVISGYLITSILISDLEKDTFSIVKFYERRARRILPALFFVMLCCIPFAWMWMIPSQFKDFSQALVAISFFASNILFWSKSGYFAPAAEENPLLHTWSLAVEEQFYIFFPIILLLLWRFGRNPVFYTICILSAISLLLAEWGWRSAPTANFYLLPTRAWELGVGSICALLIYKRPQKTSSFLSFTGLALIVFSIFFYDKTIPFPSVYALAPVGGTALIILYGTSSTLTARFLSMKFMVGIGLISFSAYLWHQPLLAFSRIRYESDPSWQLLLFLSVASIFLAYLTWKYIEQPFRNKKATNKNTIPRKAIFGYSVLASTLFASSGLYGYMSNGLPSRETPSGNIFSKIDISEMKMVNYGLNSDCEGSFTLSKKCRTSSKPSVMVWGDSHAMHLVQAITSSKSFEDESMIQFTKSVCSPILQVSLTNRNYTENWAKGCIQFNEKVSDWLSKNKSVQYVIMSSPLYITNSTIYDSNGASHNPSQELVLEKMNKTAKFIKSLGKKPVFISSPPRTGEDLSKCAVHELIFSDAKKSNCRFSIKTVSKSHKELIKFIERKDLAMPIINLEDYICNGGMCNTVIDDTNIYRDGGHLSHDGSELIGKNNDIFGKVINAANKYAAQ